MEQLLADASGDPLPRCQDLPQEAFGELKASSMLVSISHGWFFQCHPDPFGEKRATLRDIFSSLRQKYPFADILVFFDFLSISQRPYRLGQAQRSDEEQEVFTQALTCMHHCYCYSDVVIHLHFDPPVEDPRMHVAKVDMGSVKVAQVGPIVQVVGLQGDVEQDGLAAFDVICAIGDVAITNVKQVHCQHGVVQYLRRPFGVINPIQVQDRGWVYLERFITMLKMAMIDEHQYNQCIFTNSDSTTTLLQDGAQRLREAAQGVSTTITETLNAFK